MTARIGAGPAPAATFVLSIVPTLAILGTALALGDLRLFGGAVHALIIPHGIGDILRLRALGREPRPVKVAWFSLAALGFLLFLAFRATGPYLLPLFHAYFFLHFWKDLDLVLGAPPPPPAGPGDSRRMTGAIALAGFILGPSGLVPHPAVAAIARPAIVAVAAILAVLAGAALAACARRAAGYRAIAAACLAACALLPWEGEGRAVLANFIIIWHFMMWYAFIRFGLGPGPTVTPLTAWIVLSNLASALGALAYLAWPHLRGLAYVYGLAYVAGGWSIVHITFSWLPKRVRGFRVGL